MFNSKGTIFRITTNGVLTPLAFFNYTNGGLPEAELALGVDGSFYGTTPTSLGSANGTLFRVTTDGLLTTLYSFPGPNAEPRSGLTMGIDGAFYGTTFYGGNFALDRGGNGFGSIFKITADGSFTPVFAFSMTNGAYPQATMTLGNDGNFYGTTAQGGSNNWGTIFKLSPDGKLITLHSFSAADGGTPVATLTLGSHGDLYGTTSYPGTIFKLATNGAFSTLFSFSPTSGSSYAGLTLGPDGNFYGSTLGGGTSGAGTIFVLSSPDITIQPQVHVLGAGQALTYNVTLGAFTTQSFLMQWFFNGLPIAGATNPTLTISNFDVSQAGLYSVTVANGAGRDSASTVLRLPNSPVVRVDGADVGGGSVGRVGSAQISMFSSFGPNAPIYFTLDGSAPDFLKNQYQGPFDVSSTTVIRAIAYDPAYLTSAEAAPITVQILPTYQLLSPTAGGGGTSFSPAPYSGTNYFVDNTVVTVTATPSNGWSFLGWQGDATGASSNAQVTMTRDMAVEAVFGTSVISNVLGSGQILFGSPLAAYPYGTVLPVTAVPQTGSYLIGWAGALSGSNNPAVLVITNPSPVATVLFGPLSANQYSLTVLPSGGGTVSITPYTNRFASGTMVTIKATADTNQTFLGWSGDATGLQNPLSVTMTRSKVINANFSSRPILSVSPPLNGLVEEGFRFSLIGELGATNRIDVSSNLSIWVPIGWITNEFGTSQFLDSSASTNGAQFYRAVSSP